MDDFPTVDALVAGSKSPIGITANWDVLVSYSLKSLNSVLQRLWTDKIASTEKVLISVGLNEDDEEYHTRWSLHIGAPTLQFTQDGKASLTMPLDGTYQVVEKSSSGKDKPVHTIAPNMYVLNAIIPLAVVSAEAGSKHKLKGTAGETIGFDDDPDAALHVVFNFQTTREQGAVYTVDLSKSYTPEPGLAKPPVHDTFSVGLRDKLAAWISDPDHVSSIDYALAVINKKTNAAAAYLTPEQLSFNVYSSTSNTDVACLCVYMKTQGSGNQPGNRDRSFILPGSGGQNSFPIPTGYTASIMIRHDLFAQKFLRDEMLALTQSGHKTFNSVTPQGSSEGFYLTSSINSSAVADLGNSNWFGGGFSVTNVDWKFGEKDLHCTIKDGKVAWAYDFNAQLEWSESSASSGGDHGKHDYGKTNVTAKCASSGDSLFRDVSDVGLTANIELTKNKWSISTEAWHPGFLDKMNGARDYVPSQIETGVQKIDFPTFKGSLALEYFTTTNIFAPGKHLIDVAGAACVFTPYDVIILGNVIETVSQTAPVMPAHCSMKIMGTLGASPAPGITELTNDLSNGRPILGKMISAASTDGVDLIAVAKANGYDVKPGDAVTALKAADAGSDFDVRFIGGLYSFNSPPALTSTQMTIDPASRRVFLNGVRMNNTTDGNGNVTWTLSNWTYSLTFVTRYNSSGGLEPVIFTGTRTNTSDGSNEALSGSQVIVPEKDFFTNAPAGLAAGWVATIFGTGVSTILWCIAAVHYAREKLHERRQRAINAASPGGVPRTALDKVMTGFQTSIEAEMEKAVRHHVSGNGSAADSYQAAADAAREKVISLAVEAAKAPLMVTMKQFVNVIGPEATNLIVRHFVEEQMKAQLARFEPGSEYVRDYTGSVIEKIAEKQCEDKVADIQKSIDDISSRLKTIEEQLVLDRSNSATMEKEIREKYDKEEDAEAELKESTEYQDILKRIKDLEQNEAKEHKDHTAESKKKEAADKERAEQKEKRERAENDARHKAHDVYKP